MEISIWRVTVQEHSSLFDRIEDAINFIKGGLGSGEWTEDDLIVMKSEKMEEEEYLKKVEKEDGVKE